MFRGGILVLGAGLPTLIICRGQLALRPMPERNRHSAAQRNVSTFRLCRILQAKCRGPDLNRRTPKRPDLEFRQAFLEFLGEAFFLKRLLARLTRLRNPCQKNLRQSFRLEDGKVRHYAEGVMAVLLRTPS